MYIWLVCCGSIRRLIISFTLKESYYSLTLKERGIHVYLPLLWQYRLIDNFFRSETGYVVARVLRTRYTCISGLFVVAVFVDS